MLLQVLGTVIIGAGAWLALDKNSLLSILRLVKNENIEVSNTNQHQLYTLSYHFTRFVLWTSSLVFYICFNIIVWLSMKPYKTKVFISLQFFYEIQIKQYYSFICCFTAMIKRLRNRRVGGFFSLWLWNAVSTYSHVVLPSVITTWK